MFLVLDQSQIREIDLRCLDVLIGDWLNLVNQAEQSVRKNEQSVKKLEEQLFVTKYQSLQSPHPFVFVFVIS